MLWSRSLIPTMKETPEGAEIPSHILMLRAGLVSQVMAGAYTYLPLGLRALKKAEQIVRKGMDAAGAVELLMPALTPIGLFEQSGRIHAFGDVLIKFEVKRQNRKVQMALGPTHEETITDLVAHQISSYRQMPITMYQIQTKFRNEERPRFGVLRTSEFLMKDAYSFDATVEGLNKSYDAMYAAYCRIFERCGLDYLAVEAESGPIGGDASHEFMALADNGEDTVLYCQDCGYAANQEKAEIGCRDLVAPDVPKQPLQTVPTPGAATIEQVTKFLKCPAEQMIKTLIYVADGKPIAVLLRGDHEANEGKVRRAAGAGKVEMADPKVIEQVTGAPVGFAGPVGLKQPIPIYADREIEKIVNGITGANAGRNAPHGRQLRPRFPGRRLRRFAQRGRWRSLPAVQQQAGRAARHRDRPRLQAGHEVLRRPFRPLPRSERAAQVDHHGLLRHRREPHHRGLDRDLPRRQRHHLADDPGPLRGSALAGQGDRSGHEGGHRAAVRRVDRRRHRGACWTIATFAPA